jgi:hypothetical protein
MLNLLKIMPSHSMCKEKKHNKNDARKLNNVAVLVYHRERI